jgi:hypothetical protein
LFVTPASVASSTFLTNLSVTPLLKRPLKRP